jgi:agmatinase
MTRVPSFAVTSTFLGTKCSKITAAYCIAGIPLDIGTTNRSGSRDGPQAIRYASRMLIDGSHPSHRIETSRLEISDIGNFQIVLGDLKKSYSLIEKQAKEIKHLIVLGGDHGVTLPLLRALKSKYGSIGLVHFDAHVDTWPETSGQALGHGSVFYHAIQEDLVDPKRMIQIGIRSPVEPEVYDWTINQGVKIITAQEVHSSSIDAIVQSIFSKIGRGPTYLSFDIDALDPAFAPGTGTPEIGGLASWQVQAILRQLKKVDFVGMDLVEVAPAYDIAEITSLAGATIVWEYLCLMSI